MNTLSQQTKTTLSQSDYMREVSFRYWDSLCKQDQAKAFYAIMSTLRAAKNNGLHWTIVLEELFKFDSSMRIAAIDCGFLEIYND